MKTFSEIQKEREAKYQADLNAENARLEMRRKLVSDLASKEMPLCSSAKEETRQAIREAVAQGCPAGHIACDECRTELFYYQPGVLLLNGARHIGCPGCGWTSSIR